MSYRVPMRRLTSSACFRFMGFSTCYSYAGLSAVRDDFPSEVESLFRHVNTASGLRIAFRRTFASTACIHVRTTNINSLMVLFVDAVTLRYVTVYFLCVLGLRRYQPSAHSSLTVHRVIITTNRSAVGSEDLNNSPTKMTRIYFARV
jgi:hypothetical protein